MATENIKQYYNATKNRDIRSDLIFSTSLVDENKNPKVAIDCGCGAGADIHYLLKNNFTVHAFDIEKEAIVNCEIRFKGKKNIFLSKASFSTFSYPEASLVVADASLFFCPKNDFPITWDNIYNCLIPEGVFCGSFLGPDDTMASSTYNKENFWSDILVFSEGDVKKIFKNYEILHFTEHRSSGENSEGIPHQWHIFSVVAKRI